MWQHSLYTCFFLLCCIVGFSQTKNHNSWIIDYKDNVKSPLTRVEINKIKNAYGDETFKRIKKNKALEINIKDILRNRVQILKKKFRDDEKTTKLSAVSNFKEVLNFNPEKFNPLIFNFNFETEINLIYRVDGTDFLINIIPRKYK